MTDETSSAPGSGAGDAADPDHISDRTRVAERLTSLGLAHRTVLHPPIMTVDEGRAFKADMPGGHSKNLFVKDRAGKFALVVAHCDTKVDLVGVGRVLGAKGRYSFASPAAMVELLGVTPGSVTPFALLNAPAPTLAHVVLDRALLAHETVWFHPLRNTASTAVPPAGLIAFISACGYEPRILCAAAPEAAGTC